MTEARDVILALLDRRGAGKTICPSEAAREMATAEDWHSEMAVVHDAAAALACEGAVVITWKGETREVGTGPYRIGRK